MGKILHSILGIMVVTGVILIAYGLMVTPEEIELRRSGKAMPSGQSLQLFH